MNYNQKKSKDPVIHKTGKKKATKYAGFGLYIPVPTPVCDGPRGVWEGKSYHVHRLWKYVTCKKCLLHKPN